MECASHSLAYKMKMHLSKMGLPNTCLWGWSLRYSRPVAKIGYSNIAERLRVSFQATSCDCYFLCLCVHFLLTRQYYFPT